MAELAQIRAFDQRRIATAIDQLEHEPTVRARHRKPLHVTPPRWQLAVGDYRVWYTVDEEKRTVVVQAVRYKGRSTTGEIL